MNNEDQTSNMNSSSGQHGKNNSFFAAPFVEQQNKEQNTPQKGSENQADPANEMVWEDAVDFGKNEFGQDQAGNKDEGKEEFAAEAAVIPIESMRGMNQPEDDRPANESRVNRDTEVTQNASVGWLSLILAVTSLFVWPAILGPVAAIIGLYALSKGNRTLGIWSIAIGVLSFLAYIVIIPLYG